MELGVSGERRPERASIERAARARAGRFVSEAIAKAPTRLLEQALSERAGSRVYVQVLIASSRSLDAARRPRIGYVGD